MLRAQKAPANTLDQHQKNMEHQPKMVCFGSV